MKSLFLILSLLLGAVAWLTPAPAEHETTRISDADSEFAPQPEGLVLNVSDEQKASASLPELEVGLSVVVPETLPVN